MFWYLRSILTYLNRPELYEARKRLRQLQTTEGSTFFTTLFRSWSHNVGCYDSILCLLTCQAVATFSLCLLAQAYEHASNLLQVFAELEITVYILIQIDKLYAAQNETSYELTWQGTIARKSSFHIPTTPTTRAWEVSLLEQVSVWITDAASSNSSFPQS